MVPETVQNSVPANLPILNHDQRRAMRFKMMRGPDTKRLRGRRQVQNHAPFVGVGPVGKSLDRLQEFAQSHYADGVVELEAA